MEIKPVLIDGGEIFAYMISEFVKKIPYIEGRRLDCIGVKTNVITKEWAISAYYYPPGVHHPLHQDFNEEVAFPETYTGYGATLQEASSNLIGVIEHWVQTQPSNGPSIPGILG